MIALVAGVAVKVTVCLAHGQKFMSLVYDGHLERSCFRTSAIQSMRKVMILERQGIKLVTCLP